MAESRQAQTFRDIRLDGEGNTLTINQVIHIAKDEVTTGTLVPSSPYLGLRRFEERNKDLFFGRDRLVADLLKLVVQRNLVLVAGASGSGKSSVVRAGLLPQLTARLPPGRFVPLVMTPGSDPFRSLAGTLRGIDCPEAALVPLEEKSASEMVNVLTEQRSADAQWLLFVDQFEEIFTLCPANWRESFLDGLTVLAQTDQQDIKIALAMRADFLDRLGPHPTFGALAQDGIQFVLDMQPGDLRAAIEQPARKHGVVLEDGLADEIIRDLKGSPGTLPLLQYTLDLLWTTDNPADARTLNKSSYAKIERINGALRQRADALYQYCDVRRKLVRPPEQQERLRRIFLRLVDLTSSGPEARAISRRTPLTGFSETVDAQLVKELVDEKLLVSDFPQGDGAGVTTGGTLEIAHEALLSAWPRLKDWVEEAKEVLYVQNRLKTDADHFAHVSKSHPERAAHELWRGSRLEQAIELRKRNEFTNLGGLPSEADKFLTASAAQLDKEQRAEAARQQALVDANDRLSAESERYRQQLLSTYVEKGRQLWVNERNLVEALPWLHKAQRLGSTDPMLPFLLGDTMRAASRVKMVLVGHTSLLRSAAFNANGSEIVTASDDCTARVWDALTGKMLTVLRGHLAAVKSATFSPDGQSVLTASFDKTARVWDRRTGVVTAVLSGHLNEVLSAKYSPSGQFVVTASRDRTARIWDPLSGKELHRLVGHSGFVESAEFNPSGEGITTASQDNTARIWNAQTGECEAKLQGHTGNVWCAKFSPNGRFIVTASRDHTARLWDTGTGQSLFQLTGHKDNVWHAEFSPDDRFVVTASQDKTARLWDTTTGQPIVELYGHSEGILNASFSPDSQYILTSSHDRTAWLWDTILGKPITQFMGHSDLVMSAVFSPDGKTIVTSSQDSTVRLWSTDSIESMELVGHLGCVWSARFSPDGKSIVTASDDTTARIWDSGSASTRRQLVGHGYPVLCADFSQDGKYIVTASYDQTARLWDMSTGSMIYAMEHAWEVSSADFSPDSQHIITASQDGKAYLWHVLDSSTPIQPIGQFAGHQAGVNSASFCQKGSYVVTASEDKCVRIFDGTTGAMLTKLEGHIRPVYTARFSDDGCLVVTASDDSTARIWDVRNRRTVAVLQGHRAAVKWASFSPNGDLIVTASNDDTARLWDTKTGHPLGILKGHTHGVNSACFSPDGQAIVTASGDHSARIWNVSSNTRTPEDIAKFLHCFWGMRFEQEDDLFLTRSVPATGG